MYLIYRHLLRSIAGPFWFGLFVSTFLMMIQTLYRYVDLFVMKGVPFLQATEVLILSLGHTIALTVPMAALIGILMGIGQLAADQEITALKASGVGLTSVLKPLLLGTGLIAALNIAYNHYIFPASTHRPANLVYGISHTKPMMEIRPHQFTDLTNEKTIYVREKDDITGEITEVTIFEQKDANDLTPKLIIAKHGQIIPYHETDAMLIKLYDGEIHDRPDPENPGKYQVTHFREHHLHLANVERDFEESNRKTRSDREMNLTDLLGAASSEKQRQEEVTVTVTKLANELLTYQWQLLDPDKRDRLLTRGGKPPRQDNPAARVAMFTATQQKVHNTAKQAQYQDKVLENYIKRENKYLVEFHKKFAIPCACLVFALLGVPMAVTTSRSGKGISIALALLVYLFYYLCLTSGEKLADRGLLDPGLSMWLANILLTIIGIPIFVRTVRESTIFHFTIKPAPLAQGSRPSRKP